MSVAAGTLLINALNSKKTVEATSNLLRSVDSIKKTQEIQGFKAATDLFNSIKDSSFNAAPLQLAFNEINKETFQARIDLMNSLFSLLKDPTVSATLQDIGGLLSTIINGADTLLSVIQGFLGFFGKLVKWDSEEAGQKWDAFIARVNAGLDALDNAEKVQVWFEDLWVKFKTKIVEPTSNFLDQLWDEAYTKVFKPILDWFAEFFAFFGNETAKQVVANNQAASYVPSGTYSEGGRQQAPDGL